MAKIPGARTKNTRQHFYGDSSGLEAQPDPYLPNENQNEVIQIHQIPSGLVLEEDEHAVVEMVEPEPVFAVGTSDGNTSSHGDVFPHLSDMINRSEPNECMALREGKDDSTPLDELVGDLLTARNEAKERGEVILHLKNKVSDLQQQLRNLSEQLQESESRFELSEGKWVERTRDLEARLEKGKERDSRAMIEPKAKGYAQAGLGESELQLEEVGLLKSKETTLSNDPKQSEDTNSYRLRQEAHFYKELCGRLSKENMRVGAEKKNLEEHLKGKDGELEEKKRLLDALRTCLQDSSMLRKR